MVAGTGILEMGEGERREGERREWRRERGPGGRGEQRRGRMGVWEEVGIVESVLPEFEMSPFRLEMYTNTIYCTKP